MPVKVSPPLRLFPDVLDGNRSEKCLRLLLTDHPVPPNSRAQYGTAGFRYEVEASLNSIASTSSCSSSSSNNNNSNGVCIPPLDSIMVRVGIVAALRSSQLHESVGVMVTASHNDERYNGVKLVDPDGGMMDAAGETLAVKMVNEADVERVVEYVTTHLWPSDGGNFCPVVHVGYDLRRHSPRLAQCVVAAARSLGATVIDHGVVTTPQLHHCVLHANVYRHVPILIPTRPHLKGYFDLIASSYLALVATSHTVLTASAHPPPLTLLVDCACGVGYPHVQLLLEKLSDLTNGPSSSAVQLRPTNRPGSGLLNENCGSEHVQKQRVPPHWYESDVVDLPKPYCASIDGDSDRIVFFAERTTGNGCNGDLILLDGDKIACLICLFVQEELSQLTAAVESSDQIAAKLSVGIVQTAYANGASTEYMKRVLGESRVKIAKTGVKHVHAAAHAFDVGIYFEANGHGTVLFGASFYTYLSRAAEIMKQLSKSTIDYDASWVALERLKALPLLINQAVGDALSDLLLVDAILRIKQWDLETWDAMYTDLPSRQSKVCVQDRSMIQVNENETRCVQPTVVQHELDQAVQDVGGLARAFIRPSGTEDIVRVYAEADTAQAADQLADRAAAIVYQHCRGVGGIPNSKI